MKYLFWCLILISCGQQHRDRENYGTLSNSQITISSQHMGGFGRSQCLLCHNAELNIHRRGQNGIDANAIAKLARTNGINKYCLACHGPNGLP